MKQISLREIKQILIEKYRRYSGWLDDRVMFVTPILNNYQKVGSIMFSLNGSPPKGYALFIVSPMSILSFYDIEGKRWKIEIDISIPELDGIQGIESYEFKESEQNDES